MPEGTKRDREEVDAKEASKTQSGAANGNEDGVEIIILHTRRERR